jgi:hypothetical protein
VPNTRVDLSFDKKGGLCAQHAGFLNLAKIFRGGRIGCAPLKNIAEIQVTRVLGTQTPLFVKSQIGGGRQYNPWLAGGGPTVQSLACERVGFHAAAVDRQVLQLVV